MSSLRLSTSVSVSEAMGRPLSACSTRRAVPAIGCGGQHGVVDGYDAGQPGGQRYDCGGTATLISGANPASVVARHSYSALTLEISSATDRPMARARHEARGQNPGQQT